MPPMNSFRGKNHKSRPDKTKRYEVIPGKRFVVEENAEQKATRWGKILEETDRGHPKMSGGVTEPDERQTSDYSCANEQQSKRPMHRAKDNPVPMIQHQQVNKCERGEQSCFKE